MVFVDINVYILKSKQDRQNHLDLTQDCIEIGGSDSTNYKGLLAHFLGTTIPNNNMSKGRDKIYLCHACNKHSCSNPRHLYWGTPKENHEDDLQHRGQKPFDLSHKYNDDEIREIRRRASSLGGTASGKKRKGKLRIPIETWSSILEATDTSTHGWKSSVARQLGTTNTTVVRVVKTYFSHLLS